MNKARITTLALAACMLLLVPNAVRADGGIRDAWNAAYPDVCPDLRAAANDCSLCHGSGFSLNDYAADFDGLDFAGIEGIDSDNDGRTNGEEINVDCTLPGDPDSSVPAASESWSAIQALYR